MKATIYSTSGEKKAEIELPSQFEELIRKDLIKRAVFAINSHNRQVYGPDPIAGTKQGDATPKRRHKYGSTYNIGISRVRRKKLWKRGGRFGWVAAFVANVVKGRKAYPPKLDKIFDEKINKKEKRKAIRSAIAATANKDFLTNHRISTVKEFPIIIETDFEKATKTKQVISVLEKLGLKEELARTQEKKIRAGKGKMRGRKYKRKVGPLIVTSKDSLLLKSAKNVPGVDVVDIHKLNARLLAPSSQPARLTVWTEKAIETLDKENLFR